MQVVTSWTSGQADALRQALRMTNESFAAHIHVSTRTVANWRKRPDITPQPALQDALDSALDHAPDRAKAQFAMLAGEAEHAKRTDHLESLELPGAGLLAVSPNGADPKFGDSE